MVWARRRFPSVAEQNICFQHLIVTGGHKRSDRRGEGVREGRPPKPSGVLTRESSCPTHMSPNEINETSAPPPAYI
ncbi:hypothetical protein EYF80_064782 [Liparis tanakae]|uniref:Uncharacterized protein n=1 Tax=Liparis tanakae TaxID=230148 RepID=A0A4Z2E8K6_9TELE|nr:hypothetical protein EYF80_064782 [Liparis tanakae]